MADSAATNPATSIDRESFAPADGPALLRALHQNEQRQRCEATEARYRHRIVTAADVDPDRLSEQGQRILGWLCGWDEWTVGGLVEILGATRTAAVARHDDRGASAGRDTDGGTRDAGSGVREGTERFTFGLMLDVAAVLEAHGYEPCDGRQLVELQQHLLHFLHRRSDRCTGGVR